MDIKIKAIITITALGIPALLIFLGWVQQMAGYTLNNPDIISSGTRLINLGVVIYIIELIVGIMIYAYEKYYG